MSASLPEEYKNGFPTTIHRLEPIARILLIAVYDDTNIFSKFRGMRYLVKSIWEMTLQFNHHHWNPYIDTDQTSFREKWIYHSMRSQLKFPKPKDININMMPFIMSFDFEKTKLPQYLKSYHPIITVCLNQDLDQKNKICFLTVQESKVFKNKTQRRPGLHVETPGLVCLCDEDDEKGFVYSTGQGCHGRAHKMHPWGMGFWTNGAKDGIYMMSSVDDSAAFWGCKIIKANDKEVIGNLGDIEYLRSSLPDKKRHFMKANKLYWLTDRTPHEALPMKENGYRQFFRLVTHKVGLWYTQHSTGNPNGIVPDPKITMVIEKSKFRKKKEGFRK
eukprot:36774_1